MAGGVDISSSSSSLSKQVPAQQVRANHDGNEVDVSPLMASVPFDVPFLKDQKQKGNAFAPIPTTDCDVFFKLRQQFNHPWPTALILPPLLMVVQMFILGVLLFQSMATRIPLPGTVHTHHLIILPVCHHGTYHVHHLLNLYLALLGCKSC
jgi:hypothetical protein